MLEHAKVIIHGSETDSWKKLAKYLDGDAHDRTKVQFLVAGRLYSLDGLAEEVQRLHLLADAQHLLLGELVKDRPCERPDQYGRDCGRCQRCRAKYREGALKKPDIIKFKHMGEEVEAAVSSVPARIRPDGRFVTYEGRRYSISEAIGEIPGVPGVSLIARPVG